MMLNDWLSAPSASICSAADAPICLWMNWHSIHTLSPVRPGVLKSRLRVRVVRKSSPPITGPDSDTRACSSSW